jgi:hypothetical protein
MKQISKPERYLGPSGRQQAARDAAAKIERLARKAAAKKATPARRIKARTPQRAKDEATYRKEVKAWLALPENQMCHACKPLAESPAGAEYLGSGAFHVQPANQCHHKFGRRGRLLLHKPFWLPVCDGCHHFITFISPTIARAAGLLCPEGRYNDQSAIDE